MPVRRGGDVYDVYIRAVQHLAKIMISFDPLICFGQCALQMIFIHIAYGEQAGAGVSNMALAHAADSDDRPGQLIGGRGIARSAQHSARHDAEGSGGNARAAKEIPAADGRVHSFTLLV